jgi:hypothetical protein
MERESLARVIRIYEQRGVVEPIAGDATLSARQWLEAAAEDLGGVALLVEERRWRLAYKGGYDVLRNAAEVVVTRAGYRVRGGDGSHEAVFVLAHALVGDASQVFNGADMAQARQRRNSSQYIDIDRATDVDESEARRIVASATEAISVARRFIDQ